MADYEKLKRNKRRSIIIPNSLWNELVKIRFFIFVLLISVYFTGTFSIGS